MIDVFLDPLIFSAKWFLFQNLHELYNQMIQLLFMLSIVYKLPHCVLSMMHAFRDMDSFGDFSDEETDDFAGCNCAHMDDIYDYDFGLTEEKIKQLSMKRARDTLAKSCTLEDKFSDIATVRWTIRHRLKLPELVKEVILSFYPTAQIQLRGQKLLGLHNGHDYFFKGLATARAGDLMCDYKNQKLSVAQYCINIGCPVSPSAPVIKASRYVADLDFCEEVAVLPSEFAVSCPNSIIPSSGYSACFGPWEVTMGVEWLWQWLHSPLKRPWEPPPISSWGGLLVHIF